MDTPKISVHYSVIRFLLLLTILTFSTRAKSIAHSSGFVRSGSGFEDSLFDDDFPSSINSNNGMVSMCLPNYEISEGSIIRTKDSVDLGAKFINVSDVGMHRKEECLKLCCKTSYCNVAVFQEKSPGSCYMFDCGPPEDFRCKFTSQIQYMSAILRRKEIIQVPSNQPVHQQHSASNAIAGVNIPNDPSGNVDMHGGNNQHEAELSQLRGRDDKDGRQPGVHARSESNGRSVTPTTSAPSSLTLLENGSHRCSRWQFECKSSGECIAIYNACDGIPNCPDGSDEGPELHCPSVVAGVSQASQNNGPGSSLENRPDDKVSGGASNAINHIFNHKNGGVMDQNYGNQLQGQIPNGNYMKLGYDYGNSDQMAVGTNNGYGGGNSGGGYGNQYPYSGFGYHNQQSLAMNQFNAPQIPNNGQQFKVPSVLQQQQPYYGPQNQNSQSAGQPNPVFIPPNAGPKSGQMETGNVLPSQPQSPAATSAPKSDSTIKTEKPVLDTEDKVEDQILKSLKNQPISAASVQLGDEDLSPHKAGSGAVFLFIVGLAMTIGMAVIVGCRLRKLNMGTRRRRKNRLDPDYLVDGMYL